MDSSSQRGWLTGVAESGDEVGTKPAVVTRDLRELLGLKVDYHAPKFRVGEEYVLFMPAPSRLGLASPVGLAQGAFSVMPGATGKEVGNGRDFAELLRRLS